MDLQILKQNPNPEKGVKLIILPLAPISMVNDIPGTYYKADDTPDKFKLCGLFENILGWHFGKKDRKKISKQLKKLHNKNFQEKDYKLATSNSSYQPLLFDFFEIGMVYKTEAINYNDLWKRSFSRMDADVHPKGSPNLDFEVLKQKGWIKEKEIEQEKIKKKIKQLKAKGSNESKIETLKEKLLPKSTSPLLKFFQNNKTAYPMYYTSPTLREYTDYNGQEIQMSLRMDERLFQLLTESLKNCSSGYLGNSEGWVELKLEKL